MPHIDARSGEVVIRIVYDGSPEAGKTTNVQQLSTLISLQRRGASKSPGTTSDRTEFFDWLDFSGGYLDGRRVRCQLVSVPGQSGLLHRRRYLLKTADAIVFVADSRRDTFEGSIDSFATTVRIAEQLACGIPIGVILQANKQDLPGAVAPDEVVRALGMPATVPAIGSVASTGDGVMQTFILAVRLATDRVRTLLLGEAASDLPTANVTPEGLHEAMVAVEVTIERPATVENPRDVARAAMAARVAEAERVAMALEEIERANEDASAAARTEAARIEAERAAVEATRVETERRAKEAARLEAERVAAEAARAEAHRIETARIEAERLEAQRIAAEAARAEAARIEVARIEAERAKEVARLAEELVAAEAARAESERREKTARLEAERVIAEAARAEAERHARNAEADRVAEAARIEAARAEAASHEAKRVAATKPARAARTNQLGPTPPLPDANEISSGHVWPPVKGRAVVAIATAGTIAVPDIVRAWAPADALELVTDNGWIFHTSERWVFDSEPTARMRLLTLVRNVIARATAIPEGRSIAIARDAETWRMWLVTPRIPTVFDLFDDLIGALAKDSAPKVIGCVEQTLSAMEELGPNAAIPAGLSGISILEARVVVLGLDEGSDQPFVEATDPIAELFELLDHRARHDDALGRWLDADGLRLLARAKDRRRLGRTA